MTRRPRVPTVDPVQAMSFLAGQRLAVVGASGEAGNFGRTIYRALRDHGVVVVAGACPLMFLEPVGRVHRIHRAGRRSNGSLAVVG